MSDFFLGISEEHDAGVVLLQEGKIVFAINEERLSRKKFQDSWPELSIKMVIDLMQSKYKNGKIIGIGIASQYNVKNEYSFAQKGILRNGIKFLGKYFGNFILGNRIILPLLRWFLIRSQFSRRVRIERKIKSIDILKNATLKYFDHHYCHALTAISFSGFNDSLAITIDASGDGYCANSYRFQNGSVKSIYKTPFFHSIGYYYTLITFLLGFKFGQQGKVTGLAARGNPYKTLRVFENYISFNKRNGRFINKGSHYLNNYKNLEKDLKNFSKDDIAAGIQLHLENCVINFIHHILKKYTYQKKINLVLAGGVFANVLLNYKIGEIKEIKKLFIFPHMGDGGLAAGAASAIESEIISKVSSEKMNNAYLANLITSKEIEIALKKFKCQYSYFENIEAFIAKMLSQNKVIARFYGAMEYGPRALGNRSILYSAKDKSVNIWLNKRLKRSEFMPFAPVVLEEMANDYFFIKHKNPAKYMTIVCPVTEKCKKECPAVVHIDSTARPQVVGVKDNKQMWAILKEYKKLTGLGLLVNTSFNMHEEPIVATPEDAIKAFYAADLDGLAIGNFYVVKG